MTGDKPDTEPPAPPPPEPGRRRSPYVERAQLLALLVILVIVLGSQWTGTMIDKWVIIAVVMLGLGLQEWPWPRGGGQ